MSGQPEPSESQKQAYLANLRQQMNQQFVQDLMHKITDGTSLSLSLFLSFSHSLTHTHALTLILSPSSTDLYDNRLL